MKRYVVSALLVVLFAAGIWVYQWWNRPVESTASQTTASQQDVLGAEMSLVRWQTQYFDTEYPDTFRPLRSNEIAHGITAGQYLLGAVSASRSDQLAVTVGDVAERGLGELPAVKLRQQQADEYERIIRQYAPADSLVFRKKSTYEMAIFWGDNNRYAAVVVSGSTAREAELEQAIVAVITHWQWR